jgi:hypothetical protein
MISTAARTNAFIVFNYIKANFEIPMLTPLVERVGDGIVELNNGIRHRRPGQRPA